VGLDVRVAGRGSSVLQVIDTDCLHCYVGDAAVQFKRCVGGYGQLLANRRGGWTPSADLEGKCFSSQIGHESPPPL